VIKVIQAGDTVAGIENYINSGKALAIISGILISVAIAFSGNDSSVHNTPDLFVQL